MPHPFGLDMMTVMGLDPVQHVKLAADLGCRAISLPVKPTTGQRNPHGYADWSLQENAELCRTLKAVLADRGVTIALGEGFGLSPRRDAVDLAADMDVLADLGAVRISSADMGAERNLAIEEFGLLAQMAADRGLDFVIEFSPVLTIRSLKEALDAARQIGSGKASILIDAMHFFRSGGRQREIAELDPAMIGYVRISDVPRRGIGDYQQEASFGRLIPGQGDLPLREFVDALPRGQLLGLGVPLVAAAENGRSAEDYAGEIITRTRELLA